MMGASEVIDGATGDGGTADVGTVGRVRLNALDCSYYLTETTDAPGVIALGLGYLLDDGVDPLAWATRLERGVAGRVRGNPGLRLVIRRPRFDVRCGVREPVPAEAFPNPVRIRDIRGSDRTVESEIIDALSEPIDVTEGLWRLLVIATDPPGGASGTLMAVVLAAHHSFVDLAEGFLVFRSLIGASGPWSPPPASRMRLLPEIVRRFRTRKVRAASPKAARLATGFAHNRLTRVVAGPSVGGYVEFSVSELRACAKAIDPRGTINDVLIAIVTGAARRHLDALGDPPGDDLGVGISTLFRDPPAGAQGSSRGPSRPRIAVSQVGAFVVGAHLDHGDPVDRFRAIVDETSARKRAASTDGAFEDLRWVSVTPAIAIRAATGLSVKAARRGRPGPPVCHIFLGSGSVLSRDFAVDGLAPVRAFGVSHLSPLGTLRHGAISVGDSLMLSFRAFVEALPDPEGYRRALIAEWRELRAAAEGLQPRA